MSKVLKPCPFCGGMNIEFRTTRQKKYDWWFFLCCVDCGGAGGYCLTKESALDFWNTARPSDPVKEQMAEALEKLLAMRRIEPLGFISVVFSHQWCEEMKGTDRFGEYRQRLDAADAALSAYREENGTSNKSSTVTDSGRAVQ